MFSANHLTKNEMKGLIQPGISIHENVDLMKELEYTEESLQCLVYLLIKNHELDLTETCLFMLNDKYKFGKSEISTSMDIDSAKSFLCILAALNKTATLKDVADFLVRSGVDLNFQIVAGITPLHIAAYGSIDSLRILLEPVYGLNVNAQDNSNSTPARYAALHKRADILEALAEAKADLSLAAFDGFAPIHEVARNNSLECFKVLEKNKVNLEQLLLSCGFSQAPIHLAAKSNSFKVAEKLIENKVDLTRFSDEGYNAIHYSAFCNSTDVLALLVKQANQSQLDEFTKERLQYTAMGIAADKNHVDCMKILYEAKADIDKPRKSDGTTPLHRAVVNKKMEAAQFIIENSNNVFAVDNYGHSALYLAHLLKLSKISRLFIDKAINVELGEEDKGIIQTIAPAELLCEMQVSNKMK